MKNINEQIKENAKTITQLKDGYYNMLSTGTKEDIEFYVELLLTTYDELIKSFVEYAKAKK